jgi:hypothetical protein
LQKLTEEIDDDPIGVNLETQMLRCMIVMNDLIGAAMSKKAGRGFFRAFVVEDRNTGEILLNQRFRYRHKDSWWRVRLGEEQQYLSREEKVEHLAGGIERVMRAASAVMSKGKTALPRDAIQRFYPPEPEDAHKTLDWLIAQDLLEITEFYAPDGRKIPMIEEGRA